MTHNIGLWDNRALKNKNSTHIGMFEPCKSDILKENPNDKKQDVLCPITK